MAVWDQAKARELSENVSRVVDQGDTAVSNFTAGFLSFLSNVLLRVGWELLKFYWVAVLRWGLWKVGTVFFFCCFVFALSSLLPNPYIGDFILFASVISYPFFFFYKVTGRVAAPASQNESFAPSAEVANGSHSGKKPGILHAWYTSMKAFLLTRRPRMEFLMRIVGYLYFVIYYTDALNVGPFQVSLRWMDFVCHWVNNLFLKYVVFAADLVVKPTVQFIERKCWFGTCGPEFNNSMIDFFFFGGHLTEAAILYFYLAFVVIGHLRRPGLYG